MAENPPAFPLHPGIQADLPNNLNVGMTLRDWFAGQALAGLLAAKGYHERSVAATDAYNLADAMLATRENGGAA